MDVNIETFGGHGAAFGVGGTQPDAEEVKPPSEVSGHEGFCHELCPYSAAVLLRIADASSSCSAVRGP